MELGNEIFGHSRVEYEIDRSIYGPLFRILRDLLEHEHCDFKINELFEYRDYCWCDKDDCPQCGSLEQPNFHFKPTGLKIRWYKYPMRDAYSNMVLEPASFEAMVQECVDYLVKHDPKITALFTAPTEVSDESYKRIWDKIRLNSTYKATALPHTPLFLQAAHSSPLFRPIDELANSPVELNVVDMLLTLTRGSLQELPSPMITMTVPKRRSWVEQTFLQTTVPPDTSLDINWKILKPDKRLARLTGLYVYLGKQRKNRYRRRYPRVRIQNHHWIYLTVDHMWQNLGYSLPNDEG